MVPIQFRTHHTSTISHEESAMLALRGGCRWIQLRMKEASEEEIKPIARRLLAQCRKFGATFIIDDHVELVKNIEADGVHLGKNDMPLAQARQVLGEGFIIGGTANTIEDVRRLHRESADYIGCGPFRFTETKTNLSPILGLEGYRSIITEMQKEGIRLPVCAIGGITLEDIPDLLNTGVNGIAVSGAILRSPNPEKMMNDFIHIA